MRLSKVTTVAELNAVLGNDQSEYRDGLRASMRMKSAQIIGITFAEAVARRIRDCDEAESLRIHSVY